MKKVALYLRVSTEEQARIQDGSLISQRKQLEEYAEGQNRREAGWGTIVDVYTDDKSAKDMNRPEFQRLLGDVRSGKVNLILATELSRLSRSIRDFCELWDLFKRHGTSFITLREQFDTTTAAGEMMVFNLINFAQFERKQTAERISANWASRAKRGLWNGGNVPLGFERNPKNPGELLSNEKDAEQVRKIFELFLKMGSVRKTCLELTRQGVYSKRFTNKHGDEKGGGHMTVMSLERILSNRAYIGLREIGKSQGKTEAVPASWKPIVNQELFNRVQERLALNRNRYKPDEWKTYPYPLTETLICGECGKRLGGKSAHGKNRKHYYYGHPRQIHSDGVSHHKRCRLERVRAPRIEEMVLKSLKKLAEEPGLLEHWLEIHARKNQTEIPGLEGRLKTVETDLQTQKRRQENLLARLADLPKEIPADLLYDQLKVVQAKAKELEAARENLNWQRSQISNSAIDRERLLFRIRRTIENLEKTPVEKQRPIFNNLIQFAELHATKVRLGLYAPAGPAIAATGTDGIPMRGCSTNVLSGARGGTRTPTPYGTGF